MIDEIITGTALKKRYGVHAPAVLGDRLERMPRNKGEWEKFKVKADLPTVEEFNDLRSAKFTTDVESLIDDAFTEFEDLRDGLQEWFDSMPENLQSGQKGEDLQSAIDTLDSIERPDVPEFIGNIATVFIPSEKITSRPDRRDNAVSELQTAVEMIQDAMDDEESEVKFTDDQKEEMQALIDNIENAYGEAEGVEFPNMFG